MRFFEILLLAILIVIGLKTIIHFRLPHWVDLALGSGLGLSLAFHLAFEGARWQMVPVYVLGITVIVVTAVSLFTGRWKQAAWPGWVLSILTLVFCLPPVLFPVPKLPLPTGPYAIGTMTFYWVDDQRVDPYAGGNRKIMVQVWYPADPTAHTSPAPYLDHLEIGGPVIAEQFGLPSFTLSHINLAQTHSTFEPPVVNSSERFPVLYFSHGWTGFRAQNTFQVEDLVSHGYIVFSADHTYGAALTVFPDGTVALNRPDALPKNVSDIVYDKAARILGQTWVGDIRFVMDQAEKVDRGDIVSPLQGRLDLAHSGVFGHSTGGGATVETCFIDPRCKAGLTMDAWLIPYDRKIPEQGLSQPFLYMQSELWAARRNPPLAAALYGHSQAPAYRITIDGTNHYDFSDLPGLTPLAPWIGLKGPIPASRDMAIINAFSVAFFDQTLKGIPSPMLQGTLAQYPEVQFDAIKP